MLPSASGKSEIPWAVSKQGREAHGFRNHSRHPPPEGAQADAEVLASLLLEKVENFCSMASEPHLGQTEGACPGRITSFSKTSPHSRHTYSKRGIASQDFSLDSGLQVCFFSGSDGADIRPAQVKRARPGMRGRTKK